MIQPSVENIFLSVFDRETLRELKFVQESSEMNHQVNEFYEVLLEFKCLEKLRRMTTEFMNLCATFFFIHLTTILKAFSKAFPYIIRNFWASRVVPIEKLLKLPSNEWKKVEQEFKHPIIEPLGTL